MATKTFSYTGATESWTVPSGVVAVTIECYGAGGGGGSQSFGSTGASSGGASGGYAKGDLDVSSGETLYIRVGGASGGWPNAGSGGSTSRTTGGDGGASTCVRYLGDTESDTVIEGGGGGGGAAAGNTQTDAYVAVTGGGSGGGTSGSGSSSTDRANGASGGDQTCDGSSPNGGGGASATDGDPDDGEASGGGGGGGYCGGSGGDAVANTGDLDADATGGGGGSGYTDGSLTNTSMSTGGGNGGHGEVVITYTVMEATNLRQTDQTDTSIDLAWDGHSDAAEYDIYRDGALVDTVTAPTTTYTDTGLSPSIDYSYEVVPVASDGSEGVSTTATLSTAPAAPTMSVAGVGETTVDLSWGAVNDATEYRIYRAQSSGGGTLSNYTQIATVTSGTSYQDTGLLNGVEYFYVATAYDGTFVSSVSNEVSQTTTIPAITDLATPDVRETEVDLSWTNPENNATEKRVYVRRTGSDDDGAYERTGMDFNAGDYIELFRSDAFDDLSVTIVINPSIDMAGENGNWFGSADGSSGWMFYRDGVYVGNNGSGDWIDNGSFGGIPQNEITPLSFTFGADGLILYKDDVVTADGSVTGTINATSIPTRFGLNGPSNWDPPNGLVGDAYRIDIHDRQLSASEISTIHNGGLVTNGLVGYWPLDLERNGVTPDLSPYANDGTVNGPTLTGPTVTQESSLSSTATSDTVTGLLNGEEYEAYVHTLTGDNEVRDI